MVVLCPQLLLLLLLLSCCWSQGQFLTLLFLNWQVMKMGTFCSFFILLRLQVCPPTIQPFQGNQLLANIWMLWLLSSGTLLFIIPFAFALSQSLIRITIGYLLYGNCLKCERKGFWCQLFQDENMTWVGGELISLVGGRQQMKINSIHLIRRNSGQALASADVLMAVTGTKWLQLSRDNKRQIATSMNGSHFLTCPK